MCNNYVPPWRIVHIGVDVIVCSLLKGLAGTSSLENERG